MRVQGVGLEHHRHPAIRRIGIGHVAPTDVDLTVRGLFQTGDHPQQRGLATAGGPDKDAELSVFNLQVHSVNDLYLAIALDRAVQYDT